MTITQIKQIIERINTHIVHRTQLNNSELQSIKSTNFYKYTKPLFDIKEVLKGQLLIPQKANCFTVQLGYCVLQGELYSMQNNAELMLNFYIMNQRGQSLLLARVSKFSKFLENLNLNTDEDILSNIELNSLNILIGLIAEYGANWSSPNNLKDFEQCIKILECNNCHKSLPISQLNVYDQCSKCASKYPINRNKYVTLCTFCEIYHSTEDEFGRCNECLKSHPSVWYCDSCDAIVDLNDTDSEGRCPRCQPSDDDGYSYDFDDSSF